MAGLIALANSGSPSWTLVDKTPSSDQRLTSPEARLLARPGDLLAPA
jgi:hypothetical protein